MIVRPARRRRARRSSDPGARLAGRLPAPVPAPRSSTRSSSTVALDAADRAAAARLGDLRRRGAGRTLGFVSVGPSRDEHGVGELYAIYVDPDEWSRGAGRALIVRAEERLAEEYAEATLWVLEDNPRARRFYESAGWHPDGGRQTVERLGVSPPEVRYRKRLHPPG